METINIEGLDRAVILAALYNGSFQQGMGVLHERGRTGMTVEQAREELEARGPNAYFDYLHGRVMKIELSEGQTELSPWGYDRDNGQGAAARIIAQIRAGG